MHGFLRKTSKGLQPALLSTFLIVLVGSMGGPLTIFPESRSGESHESTQPNERIEEFTTFGRFDHERQLKLEQRRLAIIFNIPASSQLGHTQNVVLSAPSGHRLSNGLLAPLTC